MSPQSAQLGVKECLNVTRLLSDSFIPSSHYEKGILINITRPLSLETNNKTVMTMVWLEQYCINKKIVFCMQ